MSVKIRLAKVGRKHQISYRIVASDTRSKRDGKFLEVLGFYNPYNKPELSIDKEKLAAWTKKGAKPTLAVENLIKEGKLIKKVAKRKTAKLKEAEEAKSQAQEAEAAKPTAETAPQPPVEEAQPPQATEAVPTEQKPEATT